MFKKILIPVDGSENSWRALDYATVLGEKYGGDLVVVNVVEPYSANVVPFTMPWDSATLSQVNSALEKAGEKVLDIAKKKLANYPNSVKYVLRVGHPSGRIVSLSKDFACDAIVIGSRGLSGVTDFLLGGVSSSVLQKAPVSVLVVK